MVSQRDEVLTYNYSPLVPDMVGSGLDSWGNILLSFPATGMLSHNKISSSVELALSPLIDGLRKVSKNTIDDLGHGLEL